MTNVLKIAFLFFLITTIVDCHQSSRPEAQGYIEGRYTYILSSVPGTLNQLFVSRGHWVKKGDRLFTLDMKPELNNYEASLQTYKESQASRSEVIARLKYAQITFDRYQKLVPKGAIQQSELDRTRSDYEALKSQLIQANRLMDSSQEKLAAAKWALDQKTGSAPVDGIVFDTYFRVGEYTDAKTSILSLLAPEDIKVIFYIPEPYLSTIKLNHHILVHCDQCEKPYPGKISFISPTAEYTPPLIYSNQTNAQLVFRIEGVFSPEIALKLHPGQPVTVSYD